MSYPGDGVKRLDLAPARKSFTPARFLRLLLRNTDLAQDLGASFLLILHTVTSWRAFSASMCFDKINASTQGINSIVILILRHLFEVLILRLLFYYVFS